MDTPDDQRGTRVFATVGAIIERVNEEGKTEVVLQIREKRDCQDHKKRYNGTFEIPAGHIEEGEDLLEALKREVKEECGLDVTEVKSVNETVTGKFLHHGKVYTPFCVNNYQEGKRMGITFICRAEGKFIQKGVEDARDPRWVSVGNLKKMLDNDPDQFFTFDLAALMFYVREKEAGKI